MQRLTILFACFILLQPAFAQPAGNSNVQVYTTDNGLPSNGIKGLQWDENTGFLWLATEAGIVRFNGVDFKSYTKENTPGIATERMLFIIRNNAGKIYTSDQPGNIFFIDKNKPVLWKTANSNASINPYLNTYYSLAVSDSFFRVKSTNPIPIPFSISFDKVVCLSDTSFIINYGGTVFYHSVILKHPDTLQKGNVNDVFKIGANYFIRDNKKDIFLLNPKDKSLQPVPLTEENKAVLGPASNKNLLYWQTGMANPILISGDKAWRLSYDGKTIIADLVFTGIPPDSYIRSVQYSEKDGLLFVGTESKGLIVINNNRVRSKKRNDSNSRNRNSYYSQIELANGNILTNESDIIGDNTTATSLPIKGKFSFNISYTDGGLLWYNQLNPTVGYNCLHQYNTASGHTKVYSKILWGDLVAQSGNTIYLANTSGIGMLEGDSMHWLYKYPPVMTGNICFDFTEISPGILAIATCSGLLRFNTTTNKLDTIFSKANICVRSIWKYKDYLFFGSYGSGFYLYKNGVIKPMPLDKNKYLLYTHCFAPDDKGYCWISTNRGLFKASLAELTDYFEKTNTSVYYHYFGKKDGMEMTELNGGCAPCALKLKNNTLSFPSMDGLLWVDPEKALPVLPAGEIFIDEVMIDGKKLNADSLAFRSLPAQVKEIIVQLGFSAWCNKENIYLDYQLNDTVNWKPVNFDNEAVIRLISPAPGNYTLRIRKLNGFGVNNYTYKDIHFSISTPWYKRWWFVLLCMLAFLGVIALFFQLRTRQYKIRQYKLEKQVAEKTKELQAQNEILEKNNTIKTRLISIISHDIVTPLRFVTSAGKNLIEKRNLMSEELQQETIQEITNTSQELQLLSTNILNWIKYQNENRRLAKEYFLLSEMVDQVLGVLNSLAKQKNLVLENRIDPNLRIYQFFEPLKILVYNLLTNAINFSEKGSIVISAEPAEDDQMAITVTDNGVGMTADQIKNIMADQFIISSANIDNRKGNGLGYLIIKDLVKTMGATLHISSEKGNGTAVSVELNVTKTQQ